MNRRMTDHALRVGLSLGAQITTAFRREKWIWDSPALSVACCCKSSLHRNTWPCHSMQRIPSLSECILVFCFILTPTPLPYLPASPRSLVVQALLASPLGRMSTLSHYAECLGKCLWLQKSFVFLHIFVDSN